MIIKINSRKLDFKRIKHNEFFNEKRKQNCLIQLQLNIDSTKE